MAFITPHLKAAVRKEAVLLRQHATPEELAKLNIKVLDPNQQDDCIYGQMTGNCFSDRAHELLNKCAQPYSVILDDYEGALSDSFLGFGRDFSPIEFYISQQGANNEALISYLKGETQTLEL